MSIKVRSSIEKTYNQNTALSKKPCEFAKKLKPSLKKDKSHQIVDKCLKKTNDLETRIKTVFFIEGMEGRNIYKEIDLCMKLADNNKCATFDIISSYNKEHICEFIKSNDVDLRIIVCSIISIFNSFPPHQVISQIIEPALRALILTGEMETLPSWFKELSPTNIYTFINSVAEDLFDNDTPKFVSYIKLVGNKMLNLSNAISAKTCLKYLENSPSILKAFCLIGKDHLSLLDKNDNCEIILRSENCRVLNVNLKDRKVKMYIFGGLHGSLDHFNALKNQFNRLKR